MPETPSPSGTPAPASTAAVAVAPPKASVPVKPAAAKPPAKGKERRFFLLAMFGSWFAVGWIAMTAGLTGMLLGTARFLFPNVLSEPPNRFKVGDPKQYEEGKVVERYKSQGTWIVRNNGEIYALSTTCTHLGCTPNWLEREGKFKCPCHGSGFKISGVNFEGPAPRPLERWGVSIADDGQLVVDKSKKFQKELGQWNDPESFIQV
jgi:cytochrome b6-f complex iron-sulfur subunit